MERETAENTDIDLHQVENLLLIMLLDAVAEFEAETIVNDTDSSSSESVKQRLFAVKMFTEYHFFREELEMLEAGYPLFLEHKEGHRKLLQSLTVDIHQYGKSPLGGEDIVNRFQERFMTHHRNHDDKLRQFLEKLQEDEVAK